MNAKKILAMGTSICLMLAMFAGCSGAASKPTSAASTAAQSGESAAPVKQDPVTIKVSYPCLVVVPSAESVVAVEEAINAHLESKGSRIRLKLDAVDANNYATTIDMQQIGGEQVDLYMCLGGLSDQVAANKVLPITDYVHTALQPTLDITGDIVLDGTTFNGDVYGFPCYRTDVVTYYFVLDTDIAQNDLGLTVGDTYTVDELTQALGVLHEKYPDKVAMGVRPGANGSPNNFCLSAVYGTPDYYKVSELGSGACVVGDELKVVNLYNTDYFKNVCETAYKWNQAGYVNKDASVATEEGYDLVKADRAIGYIIGYGGYNAQITDAATDTTHGKSVMYVPITTTMNKPAGLDWCVSYNCENPEAACEALNLFYTDAFVMNTILFGVEGRDYIDTGKGTAEDKVIDLPEGQTAFTVPYYAGFTCGIMGNEYIDWVRVGPNGKVEDKRAENQELMKNAVVTPIYGFTLDTANIKNATAAISNVEAQYLGGLLTGELNPEEYIPKLVKALEDAGINDVITEAQKQLDAWAASK